MGDEPSRAGGLGEDGPGEGGEEVVMRGLRRAWGRMVWLFTRDGFDLVVRSLFFLAALYAMYWHGYYGALNTEGPIIEEWVQRNCGGYAASTGGGVYWSESDIVTVAPDKTLSYGDAPVLGVPYDEALSGWGGHYG